MRTLNNKTKAALPSRLKISRKSYARYFARTPWQRLSLYFSTFVPYSIGRHVSLGRAGCRHWLRVEEHVEHGCLGPAQVVDLRRGLIAAFTNLNAQGPRTIPVIKILRAPLHLLPERLKHEGAQIACASIFHASPKSWEEGYWEDFSPIPIDCIVPDSDGCEEARKRLSPSAWLALEMGLKQVDEERKPGLYHVKVPNEIVWTAF